MTKVFIEAYGYHAETLYPYAVSISSSEQDIVMFDPQMNGAESIQSLPLQQVKFSLFNLIKTLASYDVRELHINSVSINLYAPSMRVWWKAISLLLAPLLAKLFRRSKIFGILHENDQYFPTSADKNNRHAIFRRIYGRLHIKMFKGIYVLAPELKEALSPYSNKVQVLPTSSLAKLASKESQALPCRVQLAWLGPIDSARRNWKLLLDLDPKTLEEQAIIFDLVCDSQACEGPTCLNQLDEYGLKNYFNTRQYRPDDSELFAAVRDCDIVICLYANNSYGKIKTSGARHIALAFEKSIITWGDGMFRLTTPCGAHTIEHKDINELIKLSSTSEFDL